MESQVKHLGVIIDGNRRWAKKNNLPPWQGHVYGYKNVLNLVDWCLRRNIPELTIWVFSTENWKRASDEVGFLMNLIKRVIKEDAHLLAEKNIQLRLLGNLDQLPVEIKNDLMRLPIVDSSKMKMILNVALNYGGKEEVVAAVKRIVADKSIGPENINADLLSMNMYQPNLSPLDFIIRTSGEKRLSGFMLWHSDYAELYFCQRLWPDFSEADLQTALNDFSQRQRRFGA
jgi:undecaprenyl diphosphate synthase